eukprot:365707-Chlamydomonas_euryale.AAC.23
MAGEGMAFLGIWRAWGQKYGISAEVVKNSHLVLSVRPEDVLSKVCGVALVCESAAGVQHDHPERLPQCGLRHSGCLPVNCFKRGMGKDVRELRSEFSVRAPKQQYVSPRQVYRAIRVPCHQMKLKPFPPIQLFFHKNCAVHACCMSMVKRMAASSRLPNGGHGRLSLLSTQFRLVSGCKGQQQ